MDIGLILAIVFAVLFVGMGFAFLAVKAKQDRAQVDADMYRGLYSENLADTGPHATRYKTARTC